MIARVDRDGPLEKPGFSADVQEAADALEVISGWGLVLGLGLYLLLAPEWTWWRFLLGGLGAGMVGWCAGIVAGLALVILSRCSEECR